MKSDTTRSICFLSSEHPPYDKRVFDKEATSLAKAGFRVIHLCPDEVAGETSSRGVKVITYTRKKGKIARFLGLLQLYRRAGAVDADAYHCNEPDSWLVGVLLRILHGKFVVFDCHEHYPGQVVRWLPPPFRLIGAHLCRYYLQVMGLLTHIIVLAKYSVADDFSWSRKRQLVVLNTTALDALKRHEELAQQSAGAKNSKFTLVHIGVFRRERGSEQLLDALEALARRGFKDHRAVIVGEFKDGSEEDFFKKAEAKGVRDIIEFHRWMPFDEAFKLVCRSHAGLVLFQKDILNNVYGMPHKMFDYMLAGLPVIAPDFAPDIARVIEESGGGFLIDTSNIELLADTMQTLIEDNNLAEAVGQKGQKSVYDKYNWESDAAKLIAAYERLFSDRKWSASKDKDA